MTEEELAYWVRPEDFPKDVYERRVIVNVSNNMRTVTGHQTMVLGKWWIQGLGVMSFCLASPLKDEPENLPTTDKSTPIGSPFKFES